VLIRPTLQEALLLMGGGGYGTTAYSGRFSTSNAIYRTVASGLTGVNISGPRTVEFWVKFNSVNSGAAFCGIQHNITSTRNYLVHLNSTTGMRAFFYSTGGSSFTAVYWPSYTPDTTAWHHCAVIIDPSQTSSVPAKFGFYLDTVDQGTATVQVSDGGTASSVATGGGFGHAYRYGYGDLWNDVWLDELRCWTVARSQAEIAANWKSQIDPASANLGGYWRYENDAWVDQTSNNNDMTATGSPTFSTTIPTW